MNVRQLEMLWRDPSLPGCGSPHGYIAVGEAADKIEEFPARGDGDVWSWVVTWGNGEISRYFRAFPGGLGVVAVHYGQEPCGGGDEHP